MQHFIEQINFVCLVQVLVLHYFWLQFLYIHFFLMFFFCKAFTFVVKCFR